MSDGTGHDYNDWLARYRQAWIDRDAEAASRLFSEDALYREHPFQEPFAGRAAIHAYWARVTATHTNVELRYGRPVVTGERVAVEWWANLLADGAPLTLAGEFLLRFADNGECRELREYWVLTQARIEPPAGWGQ